MTESRINDLLSRMTLKEKIGHINQYFSRGNFAPEIVRQEKAGSVINTAGALTGASDDLPRLHPRRWHKRKRIWQLSSLDRTG